MRTIVPATPVPTLSPETQANSASATETRTSPTLPRVMAPGPDRPISVFAAEVGGILADSGQWFTKNNRAVIMRDLAVASPVPGSCRGTTTKVFHYPSANECRSLIERWLHIVHVHRANGLEVSVVQSMGRETTAALLDSPQFKETLPPIRRILDVPVPIIVNGRLEMTQSGYNRDMQAFCQPELGTIEPLPLPEAKAVIEELMDGFPFANDTARTLAIARLLTPFCHGLMGWTARTPLWVFEANRPRAGKDYLAGCCGILYEGRANEDAPLDRDSNETRKRIVAALQSGRRFMHFANTAGDIKNDAFEQAVTAKTISARLLGSNDAASDLTMDNELEFSVSGNTGFTFSEDFALRCRRISLAYFEEDANARTFQKPDLHGWVRENRQRILGALLAFVREWDRLGLQAGPTPFTSFPEWARVVGGIMVCCGLGDPCVPQHDGTFTRDTLTDDMTSLFQLANKVHSTGWLAKGQVRDLVSDSSGSNRHHDMDLFAQWDLADRKGQTAFGQALQRYKGRTLGGIRMEANETDKKRVCYRFVPVSLPDPASGSSPGSLPLGTLGTLSTSNSIRGGGEVSDKNLMGAVCAMKQVPKVPKVDIPNAREEVDPLSGSNVTSCRQGPPRPPTLGPTEEAGISVACDPSRN